ncbi:MAG TPA: PilZ domain-containing protein [Candidatus Acidoferrales bacterium]|nr:PilZ domain-containing protein [Candidatus Acidoferrales bacterium]
MPLGMGVPKTFTALRREARVPMEVVVRITGHAALPGTEATFTENVSLRGARVLSTRRWKINDRLVITTLAGSFRSLARVAYCQTVRQSGYAVGLEFVETSGSWVVAD